jgi:hypothetical protein
LLDLIRDVHLDYTLARHWQQLFRGCLFVVIFNAFSRKLSAHYTPLLVYDGRYSSHGPNLA